MRLPASVQEIANVIGVDRALYLVGQLPRCVSKKSTHVILYVPKSSFLKPDHRLVQILGWQQAYNLCCHFGGEILQPATCADLYRDFRNRSILRLIMTEQMTVKTVAEMFDMSERQVSNIVKKWEITQEEQGSASRKH